MATWTQGTGDEFIEISKQAWAKGLLARLELPTNIFGDIVPLGRFPAWLVSAYVPVMALLLIGFGWLLRYRPAQGAGGLALGSWLSVVGWAAYRDLREKVIGLDQIALSLAVFALAVLVSLGKSGRLSRWLIARGWIVPRSSA